MQTHLPAAMTPTRTPGLGRWPAVAGLGLALALAIAIGLARLGGGDAARTMSPTAVPDADHTLATPGTARLEAPPVVYIIATQEQAAFVRQFSAEINALRAELGQPQVPVGVLVVEPGTTLALDGLPAAPGTRYYDLRTP